MPILVESLDLSTRSSWLWNVKDQVDMSFTKRTEFRQQFSKRRCAWREKDRWSFKVISVNHIWVDGSKLCKLTAIAQLSRENLTFGVFSFIFIRRAVKRFNQCLVIYLMGHLKNFQFPYWLSHGRCALWECFKILISKLTAMALPRYCVIPCTTFEITAKRCS